MPFLCRVPSKARVLPREVSPKLALNVTLITRKRGGYMEENVAPGIGKEDRKRLRRRDW